MYSLYSKVVGASTFASGANLFPSIQLINVLLPTPVSPSKKIFYGFEKNSFKSPFLRILIFSINWFKNSFPLIRFDAKGFITFFNPGFFLSKCNNKICLSSSFKEK